MKELRYLPLTVLATLGVFYLVVSSGADAQTVTAPVRTGGVDFTPVLTTVLETAAAGLATALIALVGFGIRLVSAKTGLHDAQFEALMASRLSDIIHRGIDFAEGAAKKAMADPNSQIHHVKFDNFFMEQAVSFVVAQAPGLIKQFGLSVEQIQAMITARINGFLNVPVANEPNTLTLTTTPGNGGIATAVGVQ